MPLPLTKGKAESITTKKIYDDIRILSNILPPPAGIP